MNEANQGERTAIAAGKIQVELKEWVFARRCVWNICTAFNDHSGSALTLTDVVPSGGGYCIATIRRHVDAEMTSLWGTTKSTTWQLTQYNLPWPSPHQIFARYEPLHCCIADIDQIPQILVAIILPPLGVFFERGCGADLVRVSLYLQPTYPSTHLYIAHQHSSDNSGMDVSMPFILVSSLR